MSTTAAVAPIAFTRGVPPIEAIPFRELAVHTQAALLEQPAAMFQYAPIARHRGDAVLRALIGQAHDADADAVFVTNGSLQALDLLAALALRVGNPEVWVEAPTYDRALSIFRRHGGWVSGVALETDGIDVEALRSRLGHGVPAFLYTIPDFQNPGGVTMSEEKRRALAELAVHYGFRIVEDTPYRELRLRGASPPTLRELAGPEHVITIGSFSKVLSPGLRVGYVVADAQTSLDLASLAEDTYLSPAPLAQAIAARSLASGLVAENVARIRALLGPRHDHAVGAVREGLGDVLLAVPDGGYFLSIRLAVAAGEEALLRAALDAGVALTKGSAFFACAQPDDEVVVRLPFQALSPQDFADGVRRLGLAIESLPRS
jgi:2-aminoadipate transaminase